MQSEYNLTREYTVQHSRELEQPNKYTSKSVKGKICKHSIEEITKVIDGNKGIKISRKNSNNTKTKSQINGVWLYYIKPLIARTGQK